MSKYATIGGVLSIVSGALGILSGLGMVAAGLFFKWIMMFGDTYSYDSEITVEQLGTLMGVIYGVIGGFCILFGILALVGGIYAVRKKLWGLALAGSIGGIFTFFPVGIVAVIFTAMAKAEFDTPVPPPVVVVPPPPPVTSPPDSISGGNS